MKPNLNSSLPDLNKSGRFLLDYPPIGSQYGKPLNKSTTFIKTQSLESELHAQKVESFSHTSLAPEEVETVNYSEFKQAKMTQSRQIRPAGFKQVSIIGRRPTNEDSHIILELNEEETLLAIFDGHGAAKVAKICSSNLPAHFEENLENSCVNEAFRHSINEIEDEIFRHRELDEQGCTFCAVFIDKENINLCNVGDSRCIIGLKSLQIVETVDHSPRLQKEQERLLKIPGVFIGDSFGIKRVEGILSLSRSVGDRFMKEFGVISSPDFLCIKRGNADWIFIACDGIYDIFSSKEVDLIIRSCIEKTNYGQVQYDRDIIKIALAYCSGLESEADAELSQMIGDNVEFIPECCGVSKESCFETRICQLFCKMAYWLGSTDNISCIFGFV